MAEIPSNEVKILAQPNVCKPLWGVPINMIAFRLIHTPWRWLLALSYDIRTALLQIIPPRLCATKIKGRDDALPAIRSIVKSIRRLFAARSAGLWPVLGEFDNTSPLYPYVRMRTLPSSAGRSVFGQGSDSPSAVHVPTRSPIKSWTKHMSATALGSSWRVIMPSEGACVVDDDVAGIFPIPRGGVEVSVMCGSCAA